MAELRERKRVKGTSFALGHDTLSAPRQPPQGLKAATPESDDSGIME